MEIKTIEKYLADKGVPYSMNGFPYLVQAIKTTFDQKGCVKMMSVINAIAKKENFSSSSVERCMRTAIRKTGIHTTVKEFVVRAYYEIKNEA